MWNSSLLHSFIASERGATAIEYALIASSLSIVIVGAVRILGISVSGLFTAVQVAFN